MIGHEEKYDSGMIVNEVEGYFYDHKKSRCEVTSRRYSFEDKAGLYSENNTVVVWKADGTYDILNTQIEFYKTDNGTAVISGGGRINGVKITTLFSREYKVYQTFLSYSYGGKHSVKSIYFNGEIRCKSFYNWKRRCERICLSDTKGYFVEKIVSRKNKFKVSVSIRDLLKY